MFFIHIFQIYFSLAFVDILIFYYIFKIKSISTSQHYIRADKKGSPFAIYWRHEGVRINMVCFNNLAHYPKLITRLKGIYQNSSGL